MLLFPDITENLRLYSNLVLRCAIIVEGTMFSFYQRTSLSVFDHILFPAFAIFYFFLRFFTGFCDFFTAIGSVLFCFGLIAISV